MTKQKLFDKADHLKAVINEKRPFEADLSARMDEYFRIECTYNSCSLEDSVLSLEEVHTLLKEGILPGQPVSDMQKEVMGHSAAFDTMLLQAREKELIITTELIKKFHHFIYQASRPLEAGQYRNTPVNILGTQYSGADAAELDHLMEHFINQMNSSRRLLHPIEYAAICHKRLIDIHPFEQGTGLVARLLMNMILVHEGYAIACIGLKLQVEYIHALMTAQREKNPDFDVFIKFIAERVVEEEENLMERFLK